MTPQDFDTIKRLGNYAENLLVDVNFNDVLKGIKEDAILGWVNAKSPDDREGFWRDMQAVGKISTKLKELVGTYHAELSKVAKQKQQEERVARERERMNRG